MYLVLARCSAISIRIYPMHIHLDVISSIQVQIFDPKYVRGLELLMPTVLDARLWASYL